MVFGSTKYQNPQLNKAMPQNDINRYIANTNNGIFSCAGVHAAPPAVALSCVSPDSARLAGQEVNLGSEVHVMQDKVRPHRFSTRSVSGESKGIQRVGTLHTSHECVVVVDRRAC